MRVYRNTRKDPKTGKQIPYKVWYIEFRTTPATVTVEAGSSKRRRRDTLPLRADTAAALHTHLGHKLPAAQAFNMPKSDKTAELLRVDLDAARAAWLNESGTPGERTKREQTTFLAYIDDAGCFADFHALRHTFISNLARSAVHPKIAQALARHSTITLTMDRYSHTVLGEQSEAVEALPSLAAAMADELRATGTGNATAVNVMATTTKPVTIPTMKSTDKAVHANDGGLGKIIKAWPDLPEAIRRAVLAMISEAAGG